MALSKPPMSLEPEELDFRGHFGSSALRIAKVEHRGITVGQLQSLQQFFFRFADEESGILQGWWDRSPYRTSFSINKDTLNLYQLVDWVIAPSTLPYKCSFVELVAAREQPSNWFISHWWGEAVVDFISCVVNHARVRKLKITTAYWVCAYANNQHELGADLGSDPMQSSFFKALALSSGVLLILDDDATPFTRVWCCFEEYVTVMGIGVRDTPLLLDIATTKEAQPFLLTDGLTQEEAKVEADRQTNGFGISGWSIKSEREETFPLEVLKRGLTVNVAAAQASQELDKRRILNTMAKRPPEELDEAPIPHHQSYRGVNERLAGIFAMAGFRAAVQLEKDIWKDDSDLPLLRAIRSDHQMKELFLVLAGLAMFVDESLQTLMSHVSKNVTLLHLNISGCTGITSVDGLGQALAQITGLTSVHLDFSWCDSITSVDELGKGLAQISGLTSVNLDFSSCYSITSVDELCKGLAQISGLLIVYVHFPTCVLRSVEDLHRQETSSALDQVIPQPQQSKLCGCFVRCLRPSRQVVPLEEDECD